MMKGTNVLKVLAVCAAAAVSVAVGAQAPPAQGPAGGQGAGRGGGAAPAAPAPATNVIPRSPAVDRAAHDTGRGLWAAHCIDCHGSTARGSEKGPNIIRTKTVNFDRSSFTPGNVLGPFLAAGHPTQSGKASATFTPVEVVGLAHFLRQKVNDTMRGSPLFTVQDILVGDAKAGEAFFGGAGKCSTCHNATTRSLNGIFQRIPAPVDVQQRMLFPGPAGGRGRGFAAPTTGANAIQVTITPAAGPAVTGAFIEQTDFFVTLRDASGTIRTVRRTPGMKVVLTNPLQAHIDLLDVLTDKNIHDLVRYLETLK